MSDSDTAHALILPWPLSQGLRLWCGYDCSDEAVAGHLIATSPDTVTCPRCRKTMREALASLTEWVPGLREESS